MDNCKGESINLVNILRMNGFKAEIDLMNRNIKSNFKQADRVCAKYVIIIGEEEVNNKILTIKDNNTKEEYKVKMEDVIEFFDEKIEEEHEWTTLDII